MTNPIYEPVEVELMEEEDVARAMGTSEAEERAK
jgi:hypothetical protein